MQTLFRPEALEQRRSHALGVVLARRARGVAAAALVLAAGLLTLAFWLAAWQVAPGQSLLGWILSR